MPTDQKIDYPEFPAADLDLVQAFYEKAFGWSFTDYGPDYRAFTDGKIDEPWTLVNSDGMFMDVGYRIENGPAEEPNKTLTVS